MKQAPQDIFFFADFLRIRSQLSSSLSTRPSLLLATGSLRFGRRIPIYILDEGHGFRNVPISLADIHFPGSRRDAHGTACYSLSSRITGDRSRAAAASIAPVAHPFGVYRKSQISPAWCRNRSLGGAQNRSRRALPRGLARWRASTGTAAIVNRLARTLLGHGHRDYRLRHRRVFSLRARSYYARARDSRPHRRTMVAQRTGHPLGALGRRARRSPA